VRKLALRWEARQFQEKARQFQEKDSAMSVQNQIPPVDVPNLETPGSTQRPTTRLPKIVSFRDLCRCGEEVWIENDGQIYRLRRTKQGKLILTK
jgi:hemin uptake protein HemP